MQTMYCPKCATQAVEGQRFCRSCGTNLGAILDAMEGKRGPLDFETLKDDLVQLGNSLRSGFEEARQNINLNVKKTKRLATPTKAEARVAAKAEALAEAKAEAFAAAVNWREAKKNAIAARKLWKYRPRERRYSLQQATLSIFSGGATSAALYYLLNTAANSGLLSSLEQLLVNKLELGVTGLSPVFQALWVLGLIPVMKGCAHLINGIFFPPKPEIAPAVLNTPAPVFAPTPIDDELRSATPSTNEFERKVSVSEPSSVTEEATLRFVPEK